VKGPADGVNLSGQWDSRRHNIAKAESVLMSELLKTTLHDRHVALGAKMVPFAGYDMPVQYPMGVMKEHLHLKH